MTLPRSSAGPAVPRTDLALPSNDTDYLTASSAHDFIRVRLVPPWPRPPERVDTTGRR